MSEGGMLAVIAWYEDDAASQQGMSKKVFEQDYCIVARHCEKWLKQVKREFGKLAERPAVERVRAFLMSGRVRLAVLACIRGGVRLEGLSDDRPGVVQCRTLWAELELLKRGPADPPATSTTAAPEPATDPTASSGVAPDPGAEEDATLLEGMEEECDPAREAATTLTQANLDK
eukprot:45223-Lingulodinium_polyedra.AAC.1